MIPDEVTDASKKEQLSLVVRFKDVVGIIRQDFVDFIACDEGLTGEQVSVKILNGVNSLGLDPANLRGQCYDGAENVWASERGCMSYNCAVSAGHVFALCFPLTQFGCCVFTLESCHSEHDGYC